MAGLKLIIEQVDYRDLGSFEYIVEEKNTSAPQNMYIRGPYILVDQKNKNGRRYYDDDMQPEVNRYITEMIKEGRALGELNHPASAEINLERACHKIVELTKESGGNHYIGKSKILNSTPMGVITKGLILEGVKIGVSTRCLGKLISESSDCNRVVSPRLVAIDCVADPSAPKAFINGILENRSYLVGMDGLIQEAYDDLDDALSSLPKHDINKYLLEQVTAFIRKISN